MQSLSYYTIFSDEVNSKGDSILFCTRTSAAFIVSREIRDNLINGLLDRLPSEVLERLVLAKGIVSDVENELQSIHTENIQAIDHREELYVVIQPTSNCQLGCYYCGQKHSKNNLTDEYSSLIVERVRSKIIDGKYKSLFVGWFGAEPLMALKQIRELTRQFKQLSKEFDLSYSCKMVTNGVSLKNNIYKELATELNVKKIEVTLDGTAQYHDSHRYTKQNGNSFDLIYDNLTAIFNDPDYEKINCPISIRCNVDRSNYDGVSELIQLLAKDNFQKKISYFYPIGIYSWGGNEAHSKSLSKEEFAKKEIDWLIEMMEVGFTPQIFPQRVKQVCAAVSPDFEMYDTFGNVFNCTEVSFSEAYEDTPYVLGNLATASEISSSRPLSDWNDTILTDKFPCHSCKMLPVCGGSCPKSWHEDMRACPTSKFNIKEKLALGYVLSKVDLRELA